MDKGSKESVEMKHLEKLVIEFYKNIASRDFKLTYNFFKQKNISKADMYSNVKMSKDSKNVTFKTVTRRPAKLQTTRVEKSISKKFKPNSSTSRHVHSCRQGHYFQKLHMQG